MGIKKKIVNTYKEKGVSGVISAAARAMKGRVRKRARHIIGNVRVRYQYRRMGKSKLVYGLNRTEHRELKVIVSLTSWPARFSTLHICIKSLLQQSYKPDKIILYLGDDAPPESVSENIKNLVPYGLEIEHRPDNLMSHKKYIYAMQEYPDDIVITTDDDIIYDKNLVKSLLESFRKYPDAVSARTVKGRVMGSQHAVTRKTKFYASKVPTPSMHLRAWGLGGVLYPPRCLPTEAFNTKLIKELSPSDDDTWLKMMQLMSNVPVVWVPSKETKKGLIRIPGTQATALAKTRKAFREKNGASMQKVNRAKIGEHFGIDFYDYW